jgi:hypothetical protein
MSREMNTVVMVPNLSPNLGVMLGNIMFNLCAGRNHLDMVVEGYNGGLWTMSEVGGVMLPSLPKAGAGSYRVINPANYSSYEVDGATAGAALWLIALSALSMIAFQRGMPEKDVDALSEAYHAAREAIYSAGDAFDLSAIAAITG